MKYRILLGLVLLTLMGLGVSEPRQQAPIVGWESCLETPTVSVKVACPVTPLAAEVLPRTVTRIEPAVAPVGLWQSAFVSWYGPGLYGNTMAGGGTLTPDSMVVAHRSMAFGTRIEFEYQGRTCVAVVQDRGPYVGGRMFDLGPGTARALGFSGVGTVRWRRL